MRQEAASPRARLQWTAEKAAELPESSTPPNLPPLWPARDKKYRRGSAGDRNRRHAAEFLLQFDSHAMEGETMPRGDKSAYTDRQKRQAEHIEEGYEHRGVSQDEAERRAWATVNKETGGGKKSGSGRGKPENHAPSRKGGRLGGAASASRSAAARSASAKRAAATRKRKAAHG
jgi:plasmid stabilization system protein ParE